MYLDKPLHCQTQVLAIVHSVYLPLDSDEPTTVKNAGLYEEQNISFWRLP